MGILDEAIREHLELKRQQGAVDADIRKLEDEAFGAGERPDTGAFEVSPGEQPAAEGETELMGEVEPLAEPQQASPQEGEIVAEAPAVEELTPREPPFELPPSPPVEGPPAVEQSPPQPPPVQEPPPPPSAPQDEPPVEEPPPPPEEPPPPPEPTPPEEPPLPIEDPLEGDAADALQAERAAYADLPTEFYDFESELEESGVADELPAADYETTQEPEPTPAPDLEPPPEPEPEPPPPPDLGPLPEPEPEPEPPSEPEFEPLAAPDEEDEPEPPAASETDEAERYEPPPPETGEHGAEDVLEETPEFLQDTPEHDQLWFEQRPPKDFDFDD